MMLLSYFLTFLLADVTCYKNVYYKTNLKNKHNCENYIPILHKSVFENTWFLFLVLLFGFILALVFLGIIKGLIGLYICAPVGMWGLGILIDLPRPLDQYQEPELEHRKVKYDAVGWPVHPDTGERSVRAVTRKTEFCLNVVFFLTYPLAIIHTLCSLCCFHTTEGSDDECYHCVNRIIFTECKKTKPPIIDIYRDDDPVEEEDTKYVIKQLQKSRESLNK